MAHMVIEWGGRAEGIPSGVLGLRPLIITLPFPAFPERYHLYIRSQHCQCQCSSCNISGVMVVLGGDGTKNIRLRCKLRRACLNKLAHLLATHPPILFLKVAVVHVGLFFCRVHVSISQ